MLNLSALYGRSTNPKPDVFGFSGNVAIGSGLDNQIYNNIRGRSIINTTALTGSVGVIVFLGQSNFSNINPTIYTPTNSKVYNFNPCDGGLYANASPTLGTSTGASAGHGYGCTAVRICDGLITNGKFANTIIANVAIGGTTISQWNTDSFGAIRVIFARLAAAGLVPNAVLWGQGESDTGTGTSQAAYSSMLAQVIALVRAAPGGATCPFFVAHQSMNLGVTSSAVTAAQDAAVNHASNIWAGPNADAITGRQADQTHFDDTGAANYTTAWLSSLAAYGAPFA